MTDPQQPLFPELLSYLKLRAEEFQQISSDRRTQLQKLSEYVGQSLSTSCRLIFVCTHNSRRSHFGQAWCQAAAAYCGIENLSCFSGGTEATAMNPRTVAALCRAGFKIAAKDSTSNPRYLVQFAANEPPREYFSKQVSDSSNPQANFGAIMTCTDADQGCPIVPGCQMRLSLPYQDPKVSDDSPSESSVYDARCQQIAREMLFAMQSVKK